MSLLTRKGRKSSLARSSPSSDRRGGGARWLLEHEIYARDREILGLKADLNALKREVAVLGLNLLELSGALEAALRHDRPQSILELRRLVSRIKGMV